MTMKTAEQFVEDHKQDTYEQLAIIKNKLLLDLEQILEGTIKLNHRIKPTLEEIFKNESEYLLVIEPLLDKKFVEEFIEY